MELIWRSFQAAFVTVNLALKQATCWLALLLIVIVTSKSPLANKAKFVVLKSTILKFNIPSNDFARILNGQSQSMPHWANSGGQFCVFMPIKFWKKSLQISLYEHEPKLAIGFAIVPVKIVHLIGKAKPATVLMTFIVAGSTPDTCLRLVTFASIVIGPGWRMGLRNLKKIN